MLRQFIEGLRDIIYPRICLLCKKKLPDYPRETVVCGLCRDKARKNLPPFCCRCGRHLDKKSLSKNICGTCIRKQLHFDRAFSPFAYEGGIKELIHQFKYQNKKHLGPFLGGLLVDFIKDYEIPIDFIDVIVPIPLSKTKMREREFNQAEILSRCLSREFGKDIDTDNLQRVKHNRSQTELDIDSRFSNIKDCFRLKNPSSIKDRNVLLVDDVLTTGATSSEAALVLKNNRANIVFTITLAS